MEEVEQESAEGRKRKEALSIQQKVNSFFIIILMETGLMLS